MHSGPQTSGFSASQVCAQVGITYRILDYWARTGTLRPSLHSTNGSGSARRYSARDVDVARILDVLRRLGVKTPLLASIARSLEGERLSGPLLFVSPTGEASCDRGRADGWACWWTLDLRLILRSGQRLAVLGAFQ